MTSRQEGTQFLHHFGPLLDALRALGGSATPAEATDKVAKISCISEAQQNEVLPSGGPRFRNQVAWTRFYLKREGLIESSKRGIWSLTTKGVKTRLSYAQAQEIFRRQVEIDSAARRQKKQGQSVDLESPEELDISTSANYREQLLDMILALPFAGFERLCQRLLREAGFQQVTVTGKSRDNGIDGEGILEVNPFVTFTNLDMI